jgi:methylmalonyl-CoA carboxyltransferase large subunit
VFKREIDAADDPVTRRAELVEEYRDTFSTPFVAASRGLVDDVIDPGDTRRKVAMALELLTAKRQLRPAKKHGLGPT